MYNVGDHQTKYYATYRVDASSSTTTITDTTVLDVSINKRWLMFGDAQKPSSINLMLMGRDMPAQDAQAVPYLPVYDALYGDTTIATPDLEALKSALTAGGVSTQTANAHHTHAKHSRDQ